MAKKEAGITITFHDLRYVFASRIRRRGASLEDIAELLGHKGIGMTRRYAHLTPGYLRNVVGLMEESEFQTATESATPESGMGKVVSINH